MTDNAGLLVILDRLGRALAIAEQQIAQLNSTITDLESRLKTEADNVTDIPDHSH